jgi:hypothetical protein
MNAPEAHRIIENMTTKEPELRAKAIAVWDEYKGFHPGQAVNFARQLLANPGSKIGFVQLFPSPLT